MKCKKCNDEFANVAVVDGKQYDLRKRSYCLKCSPIGSKLGYALRKEKAKKRDIKECPNCGKNFPWSKNNVCSTCRNRYHRYKSKQKACKLLGNCCRKCGCEDIDLLVFHHKDEKTKSFNLCWAWDKKWNVIVEELKKCDLLCTHCHIKLHAEREKESLEKLLKYFE